MPIVIEADGFEETAERVDKMILQLRELRGYEIGREFAEWQEQDVNPKHAFVVKHRATWTTRFRPHSRWEMTRHRYAMRRLVRRGRYTGYYSTRPVLRQELLDQLVTRMEALLNNIKW